MAVFICTLLAINLSQPLSDTLRIPDPVTCPGCTGHLIAVASLGGSDGDEILADQMAENVAVDGEGHYWLRSYRMPWQLWRFSPAGTAQIIGREGRGPTEYAGVSAIAGLRDGRIAIFDLGNKRLDLRSSSGELLTSYRFDGPFNGIRDLAETSDGHLILGALSYLGESAGKPLHALDLKNGTLVASMGVAPPTFEVPRTELAQRRRVSVSGSMVAAAHTWRYQIDLFEWPSGLRTQSYVRDAKWFPYRDPLDVRPPETRPATNAMGVMLIEGGREALVLARRPRPTWLEAYDSNERGYGETSFQKSSYAGVWETVIEHIDLINARVISRTIADGYPLAFVNGADDPQVALLDDRDLAPVVHIYEVHLQYPPGVPRRKE